MKRPEKNYKYVIAVILEEGCDSYPKNRPIVFEYRLYQNGTGYCSDEYDGLDDSCYCESIYEFDCFEDTPLYENQDKVLWYGDEIPDMKLINALYGELDA